MNNVYDKKYDIRRARYDEIPEIMDFIDKYWRKGHILAVNREFFEYEHLVDGEVNYIIAKSFETREIEAILGFFYASADKKVGMGGMWMVRSNHSNLPFLGCELHRKLEGISKFKLYFSCGVNKETSSPLLSRFFKLDTGRMNHYYRIADKDEYKVALIKEKPYISRKENLPSYEVQKVNSIEELKRKFDFKILQKCIPCKDEWYIEHRFFNHPIYKYDIYVTKNAFFVAREIECNGVKVLRIVDYLGEQSSLDGLFDFFSELLKKYEYIDFYCIGLEEQHLLNAGFVNRLENSNNIIPNYFEPFLRENSEIYYSRSDINCLICKADSDQDRPNKI